MGFPETFKALADPVRREILLMLRGGRMAAGDIAARFNMTGATISYHLSQLKKAGLVYETKEKNFIYYSLNISVFEEIMLWFNQFTDAADSEHAYAALSKPSEREALPNGDTQECQKNTDPS